MSPSQPVVKPRVPLWTFLVFALLFLLQALPGLSLNSLTNDEPMEISNGFHYWTQGDTLSHHRHPPLSQALQAFPILFLGFQGVPDAQDALDRAQAFLFVINQEKLPAAEFWTRIPSLLAGLGIGLLLFFFIRKLSIPVVLTALGLWAFNPTLLAFTGLGLADVPMAFFFLASVLAFQGSREKGGKGRAVLTGALTAAAALCKFSGLVLIPVFVALEVLSALKKRREPWRALCSRWAWGTAGFIIFSYLVYLPALASSGGWLSPFRAFAAGLMDMASYGGHPTYFMGQAGRSNHPLYFPVAFLLKTPLLTTALLILGVLLLILKKVRLEPWQWLPGSIFFLAMVPVQNLGVRYLIPAFPFLFLIGGAAGGWLWEHVLKRKSFLKWLSLSSVLLQALLVLAAFPHHTSYFNESVTPSNKAYWLGDSNLDIGQDLKRTAKEAQRRGWKRVKLAYLGGVDPSVYGLQWEPWRSLDLKAPQPGTVYLVNTAFLQLSPLFYPQTLPIASGWLVEKSPSGKVADSWFYFEFPGEAPLEAPGGPFLTSVPFQQVRGYAPFPAADLKTHP